MRVCLLSARFPPDHDGNGDYTYFLACALARTGCEVEVLTSVGELDPVLYPLAAGLRVHRVAKSWGIRGLAGVVQLVRRLDPDALLIQYTPHAFDARGITFAVNILPLLVRVVTRTRVITNFHELFIPFDHSLKHWLGALWQRAMAFLMAAPSHGLTAISREWPERLRRVAVWKRVEVIPVGSNIPRAGITKQQARSLRDRLGGDGKTLVIGSFGSGGADRDIQMLLAGLRELKQRQSVKLIWLGASGLTQGQWATIAPISHGNDLGPDVLPTGHLSHPEISRMMSACDLLVLLFRDGVSTKRGTVAAALLHGLPILTTKGKLVDDLFVHGENVYLVPAGNAEAFSQGLRELARHPDLRARLGRGARTLYDSHFDWDVIAHQVVRVAQNKSVQ